MSYGVKVIQGELLSNLGQLDQAPCFGPETRQTSEAWFSAPAQMPGGLSLGVAAVVGRMHLAFRYRHPFFGPVAATRFTKRYLAEVGRLVPGITLRDVTVRRRRSQPVDVGSRAGRGWPPLRCGAAPVFPESATPSAAGSMRSRDSAPVPADSQAVTEQLLTGHFTNRPTSRARAGPPQAAADLPMWKAGWCIRPPAPRCAAVPVALSSGVATPGLARIGPAHAGASAACRRRRCTARRPWVCRVLRR